MNDQWNSQIVSLKYMLSDLTLYTRNLSLKVSNSEIIDPGAPIIEQWLPSLDLDNGEQGYLRRSLPLAEEQPRLTISGDFIYYIPAQFERCYIDLKLTYEEYLQAFSSKTRSTIKRKIKKFAAHCSQSMHFKVYRNKQELQTFYPLARALSRKTYQEKLLNAGLPDSEAFQQEMESMAEKNQVRAYLLFDHDIPVAYMYCPVYDGVLLYQYLGFDPDYQKWSVGTILHWFVFEDLYREAKFRYFDFTEGQSEHKQLYSTNRLLCGNIFIIKNSFKMQFCIRCHMVMEDFSRGLGLLLDKWGLKAKIKQLIRFRTIRP